MNRFQWGTQEVQRLSDMVKSRFPSQEDVDRDVEASFRDHVAEAFPSDVALGEEIDGDADWTGSGWVLDPIDGTTNFQAGFERFAVCLAYLEEGRVQMGWVVDPVRGSTWSAERGSGAWRDGERIHVRGDASQSRSLMAVSSWFRRQYPEISRVVSKRFKDRSLGSVALEMVMVAEGVFVGGFWHDVRAWDMAAASLLIEEAGGIVTTLDGSAVTFAAGSRLRDRKYTLMACSSDAHSTLCGVVTPHLSGTDESGTGESGTGQSGADETERPTAAPQRTGEA